MKASIIIRTKNEAKRLPDVLSLLNSQTEKDFEVILVDSGSNDQTIEIARLYQKKLDLKIFEIASGSFSYPYACNFGAERASGEYLVYISGHSIPIDENWLKSGLFNMEDKKVAGAYGNVLASEDASIWEKLWYFHGRLMPQEVLKKPRMGILGNTNAIIPKKLWREHHFDEKNYVDGGEDGEWASYFIKKGYTVVKDPGFSVFHSHGLGLIDFINQLGQWKKQSKKFMTEWEKL